MAYVQTDEVYRQIKQAIADKEPYSLVRLGDGEAKLIGYPQYISRRDLNTSLEYWYGPHKPDIGSVMQLRQELMAACRNADMLGLPSRKQQAKNPFYKLMMFLVMKEGLSKADTTHCGVHRWLHSEGLLADILNGLPSVTVITCRDVCHKLQDEYNVTAARWIWVPEEANAGQPKEPHYPQRHSKVIRQIDAEPGDVYLIGAGPNGKVYADAVKRDGGIGLDLGSWFDLLAGIPSRSYIAQELAEQ
jgi:hypothetical protein